MSLLSNPRNGINILNIQGEPEQAPLDTPHFVHQDQDDDFHGYNNDTSSPADPPSWDRSHISIDCSESNSEDNQIDKTDLQPGHKFQASDSSQRMEQIQSHVQDVDRHSLHPPPSSGSGVTVSSVSSHPTSIRSNNHADSIPPIPHGSITGTTISHSNRRSEPLRRRTLFAGVTTRKLLLQEQHSTRKPTLPILPHRAQPPPVAPNNAGKDNASHTLDGLEMESNWNARGTANTGGSGNDMIIPSTPQTTGTSSRFVSQILFPSVASSSSNAPLAPVAKKGQAPVTSLADALGFAFTENALHTQLHDSPPEPRRTFLIPSAVPMKVTSSTSSIQTRPQTEHRQSYVRRSKVLLESVEKGKGRTLDQDELEDLLNAGVANIVYDKEAGSNVSDHARRSNLRHLLGAATLPSQPETDGRVPEDGTEEGPMHVPPRFAKRTVSRDDQFLEMLGQTFGPDSPWGGGPKPKPAVKSASDSDNPQDRSPTGQDGYESDAKEADEVQGYRVGPGKRRALGDVGNGDARQQKQPRTGELESTSFPKLHNHQAMPAVDRELADSWVVLLQGLVKGKMKMDRERMVFLSDVLNKVDQMKALVSLEVAVDSKLWQTMLQLSEMGLEGVPFGDEHGILEQAIGVASFWRLKWLSEVQSE